MDLQALYDQAVAAHRQGDLAGAEEAYLRLLSLKPGNPHLRHSLGALRAQQGRGDEALALLEGVVAQSPPDAGLLKDYGLVLAGLGRDEDALAVFARALALKPGDVELTQLRIDVLLRLKRPAEALALRAGAARNGNPFASAGPGPGGAWPSRRCGTLLRARPGNHAGLRRRDL